MHQFSSHYGILYNIPKRDMVFKIMIMFYKSKFRAGYFVLFTNDRFVK
jgi:hypothetical protein